MRTASRFAALLLESGSAEADLAPLAREWSPRVETIRPGLVLLDASGLTRLFGSPAAWARRLAGAAGERGWTVRVAVAGSRIAAILLALGRRGVTVVESGGEAEALAPLSLTWLVWLEASGFERPVAPTPALPAARSTSVEPIPDPRTTRTLRPRRPVSSGRHYRLAPSPAETLPPVEPESVTTSPSSAERQARAARLEAEALLETLQRWGLTTLGELAALAPADVASRLGDAGRRWHARARGQDAQPFADDREARSFQATLELEWPIEGLEPLSFVLARLLEPLCDDLLREERGAVQVHTRLDLVTRTSHARTLQLPAPMHDAKVLRTLILLDLEAHPPDAGIDRVTIHLEPAPGRRVQFALFRRPLPAADQVATLMARLNALMGEGRSGSPQLLETHRPGAFAMVPFAPRDGSTEAGRARRGRLAPAPMGAISEPRERGQPNATLRRLREPVAVQITLREGRPARLGTGTTGWDGGLIAASAGPWRTSGEWWRDGHWQRDEWDVVLRDGPVYRLSRDHATDTWVIEGTWD